MADYSVLTGYDDSGVPQYDTITIPDTVTPPEQPAPGGGTDTPTDNAPADVGTTQPVTPAEPVANPVSPDPVSGDQPTDTTGGGGATTTDNPPTDISTAGSTNAVSQPVSPDSTVTDTTGYNTSGGDTTTPTETAVPIVANNNVVTPASTAPAPAAPTTTTPTTVTLVSGTGTTATAGNPNTFHSGDNFNLTVTGTPGQPVYVTQNGGAPFLFGYVGADGTFVAPPTSWSNSDIGSYNQTWTVGTPGGTGSSSQTINFNITGQGGGSTTATDNTQTSVSGTPATSTVVVTDPTAGAAATSTNYGNFNVGDQFTAKITGNPGDPVYVTQTKDGVTSAPFLFGYVGSDGIFVPPYHSWSSSDIGVYSQSWQVGAQTTTVNFTISQPTLPDGGGPSGPSDSTGVPSDPVPVQPAGPQPSGGSFTTNQNTPVSFGLLCTLSGPGVTLGGSRTVTTGGNAGYGPVTLTSQSGSGLVVGSGGYGQFGYNSPFVFNIANQQPGATVSVSMIKNGQQVMTNQPAGTVGANGNWTAPDQHWDPTYQGAWQQVWTVTNPDGSSTSYPLNFTIGSYDIQPRQTTTSTQSWPGVNITQPRFGQVVATNTSYSGTGTATITFQYTPNQDYVGADYFTYTVTDSNELTSGSAQVNIQVNAVMPAPVYPTVSNGTITVDQNYNVLFTFQTGTGATGITQISGPSHGTIQQVSGFQYRYTPAQDYAGSDAISFRSHYVDAYNRDLISQNLGVITITVVPQPIIQRPDPIAFTSLYSQTSNVQITGSTATLGTGFPDTYYALLECITDNAGTGSTSQLTASYVKHWQRTRSTATNSYLPGVTMNQYGAYFGDTNLSHGIDNNTDDVTWFDTQTPSSTSTVSAINIAPYPTAYDFNFDSFTTSNTTGSLTFNGAAGLGPSNVLRLTPAINGTGSCFTTQQYPIGIFNSFFRFQIPVNGTINSGFTLAINPMGPTVYGYYLGYSGLANSVAVEFAIDSYGSSPAGNTVRVVRGGDIVTPVAGQTYSPAYPSSLGNGSIWSVWVDYDGTTLNVYLAENSTTKPASPQLSVPINIPAVIGSTTAWVGFTGGTVGTVEDIWNWTWQTNNSSADPQLSAPMSRLYTGYFRAPVTDTYTFTLQSDDACYVWLGATALSGYTKANALVKAGGPHPINYPAQTNTISLTAGTYYPIRVIYGNGWNPGYALVLNYSTSTIASTIIPASQLWRLNNTTSSSTTETLGNYIEVVNGDQIAPVIMSPQAVAGTDPNFSRILTYRVTLTGSDVHPSWVGQTTTFQVGTTPVDLEPTAFVFAGADGLELSVPYTTNTVTITGLTPGISVPVRVSPTANLIINGVNLGVSSSTIQNGQTLAIQAITASSYVTPRSFTVTVSDVSDTFVIKTRAQHVQNAPWYFGDRTGLEISTRYQTANSVIFASLEGTGTISVSSGNVIVNGVDLGVSSTTIGNNDTVAFNDLSSASYGTTTVHTVTFYSANASPQTQTDTFSFTTRTARTVPVASGAFVNQDHLELISPSQSNTLTFINFDVTVGATLASSDSTAYLIKNGTPAGTSTTIVNGDTLAIAGTTNSDYYMPNSYNLLCGPLVLTWQTRTKSNDDLHVLNDF